MIPEKEVNLFRCPAPRLLPDKIDPAISNLTPPDEVVLAFDLPLTPPRRAQGSKGLCELMRSPTFSVLVDGRSNGELDRTCLL